MTQAIEAAFANGETLRKYCLQNNIQIWEAMIRREIRIS